MTPSTKIRTRRTQARRLAGLVAAGALAAVALSVGAPSASAGVAGANGKIAFGRCEDGSGCHTSKLWTMNPDGSGQARLLADPGYWDDTPGYSADARKLVFQRCTETTHECGIATVDVHGNGLRQLTPTAFPIVDDTPSFSPDGSRIVFTRFAAGEKLRIWIMASDGSNAHALTDGSSSDGDPEFSPDGTRIVFFHYSGTSSHIWIMNADGSNQHPVTSAVDRNDGSPTFSSDGSRLAFQGCVTGGLCAIWTAHADGSDAHQLTSPSVNDGQPQFSPDGKQVVFQRQLPDYTTRVFTQPLSGGPANQLTFSDDLYVSWARVPTPSIDTPPTIAGVARAGHALTATAGPAGWGGTESFQWLRCTAGCTPIAGAIGAAYKPTNADVGTTLKVRQTQTSSGGSVSALSAATAPVAAEPGAPIGRTVLRLSGGRLLARLSCPVEQSVLCGGRLTLTARVHGRSVKVAAGSFQLAAGTTGKLTLHISKTARKALAKTHRVTARLVTRDDAGNATRTSAKVTVKRG